MSCAGSVVQTSQSFLTGSDLPSFFAKDLTEHKLTASNELNNIEHCVRQLNFIAYLISLLIKNKVLLIHFENCTSYYTL